MPFKDYFKGFERLPYKDFHRKEQMRSYHIFHVFLEGSVGCICKPYKLTPLDKKDDNAGSSGLHLPESGRMLKPQQDGKT